MSADFKYFPDVFGEVVTATRSRYDLVNGVLPYYEYGTYLELLAACQLKDNNQEAKYPLVWLVWDTDENQQDWREECMYSIAPRVFITDLTSSEYTTEKRYTNTLKAILYPIFELLLSELGYHRNFELGDDFRYPVNDHPFWLNNDVGTLDILSAIEIKFENLLMIKS